MNIPKWYLMTMKFLIFKQKTNKVTDLAMNIGLRLSQLQRIAKVLECFYMLVLNSTLVPPEPN